jgi:glucokinase
MNFVQDNRIVLTLDAGGTNFKFSAIRGNQEVGSSFSLPSNAQDLGTCLDTIVAGFTRLTNALPAAPVAISFAFPGPADYVNGIIGDLGNLPSFRGGVALGPMLQDHFGVPVFINNDGDLFGYGEAMAGFLPWVNQQLTDAGSPKRFRNLIGLTLGTGLGGAVVTNGELLLGDNGAAAEIWSLRNRIDPELTSEEGASIRAVQRVYAREAKGGAETNLTPKDIAEIAFGGRTGDQAAARAAWRELGRVVGNAAAHITCVIDGLVVIGGGLSGAAPLFMPAVIEEMNATLRHHGQPTARMELKAYNLEDAGDMKAFVSGHERMVQIPGSKRSVPYDPDKRTGVGISKLGTSHAVALGAYAFALHALG